MSLAGPVLPVLGPLLAGGLLLLLRRWQPLLVAGGLLTLLWLRSGVNAVVAGESGRFAGDTWVILGRSLELSDGVVAVLLLLYACLGLLFLLSLLAPQGRLFVPGGVLLLSPLAAALMVSPFTYGALALVVAGGLLAVLIQARAGSTQGALRLLLMLALAVPFLLVAGWMMENEQGIFVNATGRLLLVALIILLAGFPFHLWVAPILREAPSLVPGLIFGLLQLLILLFVTQRLLDAPQAVAAAEFGTVLRWSGAATMVLGGLLALQAVRPQRLLAYLLLIDGGVLLLGLSQVLPATAGGEREALTLLLTLLLGRFAALTLAGFGLSLATLRPAAAETDGATRLLSLTLFAYGAFSLVGLPLTPNFFQRAELLFAAAGGTGWLGFVVVGAAVAGVVATVRGVQRLHGELAPPPLRLALPRGDRRAQLLALSRLAALLLLLAAGLAVATTPPLLTGIARQLAAYVQ